MGAIAQRHCEREAISYRASASSFGPRESQRTTLPCVYQSPSTMRLALRLPRSTVWTSGRCVCPCNSTSTLCSRLRSLDRVHLHQRIQDMKKQHAHYVRTR